MLKRGFQVDTFLAKRGAGIVLTLRFFSQPFSFFRNFSCINWLQSAKRRCQILGISEKKKKAEDGSPQAHIDVPCEFRVSGCEQESRLIIPLELGMLMG